MITGRTRVMAHPGRPTEAFKAPMIYNPWFGVNGVDAVVVPLGVPRPITSARAGSSFRSRSSTAHGLQCRTRPPRPVGR